MSSFPDFCARAAGVGGAAHTLVQTSALSSRTDKGEIGQTSALTGQRSAPCDGAVTIIPPDPNLAALHQELRRLRAERGWSYDDLAERTGVSRRTLIDIEAGRTVGYLTTWHALAHAFGVPLGELAAALCEGHQPPRRIGQDSP